MPSSSEDCMIIIENDQFRSSANVYPVTPGFSENLIELAIPSCSSPSLSSCAFNDDISYSKSASGNEFMRLRYLCQEDVDAVKSLCKELFPVDYPDFWYNDVVSDPSFWSMAAVYGDRIIGICIAEIKRLNNCNGEDRDILSKKFPANTPVCYMLSLGVDKSWRRRGIASLLLDQLLAYICNTSAYGSLVPIRALYLHVLMSNKEAILFYERRKFRRHAVQFEYYNINGKLYDGFTYVLYLNGGHAALSCSDTIISCGAIFTRPWRLIWNFVRKFGIR